MKINKGLHDELCKLEYKEYLFGSRLHGVHTEESDTDVVRIIGDGFYSRFNSVARYYPNIHSFQYTEGKDNQYIWMTERQFWYNLFHGDGNMLADIVLLSEEFDNSLFLCRTYKIIKGYLGLVKRDLKLHPKFEKKRFHAARSLYMAGYLINNLHPSVKDIVTLKNNVMPSNEEMLELEKTLRSRLNSMLDSGAINMYPMFDEQDLLAKMMMESNNIREFKYDK